MELLFKWLSLLADCLNGKVYLLEGDEPCYKKISGRRDLDVILISRFMCDKCGNIARCGDSSSFAIRLVGKAAVFNFRQGISEEKRDVLLELLALTAALVKEYCSNREQEKRLEFLESILFFLASRFFNGFYLKDKSGAFSLLTGEFPLSYYEDLEFKRRKLDMEEGAIESGQQTFWFKIFASKEGEAKGILYWQPKEASSVHNNPNSALSLPVPLIGKSPSFVEALNLLKKTASSENTILLYGESGTGKELFAKAIHFLSPRRDRPFIAINCAAIPENLLESELFGYEEGSFTGAKKGGKPGKFELANGGTLFLDEIGDMPLALQAKLLRVLQDKRVERIGGTRPIPVDIRFIAATHRNLEELVQRELFRQDLYFRLNVIPIKLPALRERREDIELLLNYYLRKHSVLHDRPFKVFAPEVIEFFKNYSWPGNIRELENVVAYAVSVCSEDVIELKDLQPYLKEYASDTRSEPSARGRRERRQIPGKEELLMLIEQFGRDTAAKREIARHLGISLATLYRWLQRYHIK